ncbi:hypothetical protein A4G18_05870 [Pasteurellaceae bacterium Pebbles2]|nr:hypothetical protein [Pasteurellaceae bacterium Pebbles2]
MNNNSVQAADILISFVVPVYNDVPYLANCLNSLLAVRDRKEIILINDGSTDNSLAIMQEYQAKHPEIIRIINQPNQGVSVARNNGIEAACGEWIFFVDGDDEIAFNEASSFLKDAAAADLVKGFLVGSNQFGQVIGLGSEYMKAKLAEYHLNKGAYQKTVSRLVNASGYFKDLVQSIFTPEFTTYFYRRRFLNQHHLRFPVGYTLGEDSIFVVECYLASADTQLLEINRILYHYIIRSNSAVSHFTAASLKAVLNTSDYLAQRAARIADEPRQMLVMAVALTIMEHAFEYYFQRLSPEEREKARHICTQEHLSALKLWQRETQRTVPSLQRSIDELSAFLAQN